MLSARLSGRLLRVQDDHLNIKVTDFGLSHRCSSQTGVDMLQSKCGTPMYMAPEVHQGMPYTAAVDIWVCCRLLMPGELRKLGSGRSDRRISSTAGFGTNLAIIATIFSTETPWELRAASSAGSSRHGVLGSRSLTSYLPPRAGKRTHGEENGAGEENGVNAEQPVC